MAYALCGNEGGGVEVGVGEVGGGTFLIVGGQNVAWRFGFWGVGFFFVFFLCPVIDSI